MSLKGNKDKVLVQSLKYPNLRLTFYFYQSNDIICILNQVLSLTFFALRLFYEQLLFAVTQVKLFLKCCYFYWRKVLVGLIFNLKAIKDFWTKKKDFNDIKFEGHVGWVKALLQGGQLPPLSTAVDPPLKDSKFLVCTNMYS